MEILESRLRSNLDFLFSDLLCCAIDKDDSLSQGLSLQPQKQFLIPVRKYFAQPGRFFWPRRSRFCAFSHADLLPLGQLAADLLKRRIASATVSEAVPGTAALRIFRDPRILCREAYRVVVAEHGIALFASADAGAYYAIQTLRDMLDFGGRALPCCIIEDRPDFPRRGVYHDCSRGKVPKIQTLMDLVERLAHWKINELQLYIENIFTFRRHPSIGKGYCPFTRDEIRRLQSHCERHHIRLVGSLASLGHMEKILALPRYTHLGELPGFRGWPGGTTLCPTDPRSMKLIAELYDEFVPIFKADDFNVCGDEPWELGKGRSRRVVSRIGKARVYLSYILELHRLCLRHGKRMNMWADIVLQHPDMLPQLPKDIVLLNWEYEKDGPRLKRTKEIARAGLPLMVCPGTSAWNTHGCRLPNATANVMQAAEQGMSNSAEGLLNTDWGDNGHRNLLGVSLHGFAHGAACSWNSRAVDHTRFTALFCRRVFGHKGESLVKPLRTLGSTYLTCGAPQNNGSALFHALSEPLTEPRKQKRIPALTANGCRRVIDQLIDPGIWPEPTPDMEHFEALVLREFRLAAAMDVLAAQRALVAKRIHLGKAVGSRQLRAIAEDARTIAGCFRALWLARNKPSRLRDNLALFKHIETEALKLAEDR